MKHPSPSFRPFVFINPFTATRNSKWILQSLGMACKPFVGSWVWWWLLYIGRDQLIPLYVKYTFSVFMACCFRGENSQEIIGLFVEVVHKHSNTADIN